MEQIHNRLDVGNGKVELQDVDEACYSFDSVSSETQVIACSTGYQKSTSEDSSIISDETQLMMVDEHTLDEKESGTNLMTLTEVAPSNIGTTLGCEEFKSELSTRLERNTNSTKILFESRLEADFDSNSSSETVIPSTESLQERQLPDFGRLLSEEESLEQVLDENILGRNLEEENLGPALGNCLPEVNINAIFLDADVDIDGIEDDDDDVEPDVVNGLQSAAQCYMKEQCCDRNCLFYQELIKNIKEDLNSKQISRPYHKILCAISKHSTCCETLNCTVPWCFFFFNCRKSGEIEQVASLKRFLTEADLSENDKFLDFSEDPKFIMLDDSVSWASGFRCQRNSSVDTIQLRPDVASSEKITQFYRSESKLPIGVESQIPLEPVLELFDEETNALMPRSEIDFLVQISGCTIFCRHSAICMSTTIPPMYLKIKQLMSYKHNRDLWKSLRNLRHENIQEILWICLDSTQNTICQKYQFETRLVTLISTVRPRTMHSSEILKYSIGLVSAAEYLASERNIWYLSWTASKIKLNETYTTAKLSDFSLAVQKDLDPYDTELVISSLPPNILPPEIFEGILGECTVVWGIGCILFHMTTGLCLHHDLIHISPDELRAKMEEYQPGQLVNLVLQMEEYQPGQLVNPGMVWDVVIWRFLSSIFVDHGDRITLNKLKMDMEQELIKIKETEELERREKKRP